MVVGGRVEVVHLASIVVLRVFGEHDVATRPHLSEYLKEVARPGAQVVVEMSQTAFVDSTVLHALGYGEANADGLVVVAPHGSPCRRLMNVTDYVFDGRSFECEEDALAWAVDAAARRERGRQTDR